MDRKLVPRPGSDRDVWSNLSTDLKKAKWQCDRIKTNITYSLTPNRYRKYLSTAISWFEIQVLEKDWNLWWKRNVGWWSRSI